MSKNSFVGELIHAVAIRMRAVGSGNLQSFLRSLDNTNNVQLRNHTLISSTNIEPTILSNFVDQRIQLELRTTAINETFTVSRIVIFIKPVAQGYPIP